MNKIMALVYDFAESTARIAPQHGDVAYYEACVPGGDPYRVTVVWRHRDPAGQGWYNVAGVLHPIDVSGRTLHLLVRNGEPAAGIVRLRLPLNP